MPISHLQLADQLADRNRKPFDIPADAKGSILTPGKHYEGDIWHNDIYTAVKAAGVKDTTGKFYISVCTELTNRGFWVHS